MNSVINRHYIIIVIITIIIIIIIIFILCRGYMRNKIISAFVDVRRK